MTLDLQNCNTLIEASMPTQTWLDPLYFIFILYHLLIIVLFGYFNEEHFKFSCKKQEDEDDSAKGADIESATRLI